MGAILSAAAPLLMILSVAMTAYTTKLICDDVRFEKLSPVFKTMRSAMGCKLPPSPLYSMDAKTVHPSSKDDTSKKKNEYAKPKKMIHIEMPPGTVPDYAKVISGLREEDWPLDLGSGAAHSLGTQRIPRLMRHAPMKLLGDLEASFNEGNLGIWNSDHPFLYRDFSAKEYSAFARENYQELFSGLEYNQEKRYFATHNISVKNMFQVTMDVPQAVYVHENYLDSLELFVNGGDDQLRVYAREDLYDKAVEEGKTYEQIAKRMPNSTHVFALNVESPGATFTPVQSFAHIIMMQITGRKAVLLFPPEKSQDLALYPLWHFRRRQSMLDFSNTLSARAAKNKIPCIGVVLEPGQTLYVPPYWLVRTSIIREGTVKVKDFSISVTAMSAGYEQLAINAVEEAANFDRTLAAVGSFVSEDDEFKYIRAGAILLIAKLLDKMGMGARAWLGEYLMRAKSDVEALDDNLYLQCHEFFPVDKLGNKAVEIIEALTNTVVSSRSMLDRSYDGKMPEEFGDVETRIASIWRIAVSDYVEKIAFKMRPQNPLQFLQCVYDYALSKADENDLKGNGDEQKAKSM